MRAKHRGILRLLFGLEHYSNLIGVAFKKVFSISRADQASKIPKPLSRCLTAPPRVRHLPLPLQYPSAARCTALRNLPLPKKSPTFLQGCCKCEPPPRMATVNVPDALSANGGTSTSHKHLGPSGGPAGESTAPNQPAPSRTTTRCRLR